ncbi:MAG: ATP-dependent zinc metalloprotease FtsH, partial [Fusobacteriaceae bacterium]
MLIEEQEEKKIKEQEDKKNEEKMSEEKEKEENKIEENKIEENKVEEKKENKKESFSAKKDELKEKLKSGFNSGKKPEDGKGKGKFNLKGLIMLLFIITLFMSLPSFMGNKKENNTKDVAYSEFLDLVKNKSIIKLEEKEGYLYGYTTTIADKEDVYKARMITDRLGGDPSLVGLVESNNVSIKSIPPTELPFLLNLLVSWFPMLLLIGVWIFMLTRMNKGGGSGSNIFNVGKSKVKETGDDLIKVTFDDVAGIDEAKLELEEVVQFLKESDKFKKIGAKIPKGVLLLGSPGTGKTLLAKAVAGEAGVPFLSMSGSEFVEMFVGVGASRVRDLFAKARKVAPCIIFIDEIDAVGRKRGSGQGGGNDEREQTLNQLLVEMDGFGNDETIIILAATNRPEVLDRALMRPGRFDRQVVVDAPDIKGREAILRVHMRNKKLAEDVDLDVVARKTPGFVGADLANLLNEAAILAARDSRDTINMSDLEEASEKVMIGPERKSRVTIVKEREIVAYHEVGHALTQIMIEHTDPVHKVTIIPRGSAALGYTMSLPTEDKYLKSKKEYISEIKVLLAGRAAEKVIFNDITTGAGNDIQRATAIAHAMVTKFGMNEKFGPILLDSTSEGDMFAQKHYSEITGKEIDDEIRKIITDAYSAVITLLTENRDKLIYITKTLLERETITGEELKLLNQGETLPELIPKQPKENKKTEEKDLEKEENEKEVVEEKTEDIISEKKEEIGTSLEELDEELNAESTEVMAENE